MKAVDHAILLVAEGLGLGRIAFAPGTWGSLWGIPLGWLLGLGITWPFRCLIGIALFLIGVPLCSRAAQLLDRKDPSSVVWDEVAAFPLVYAFVPINAASLLTGFVLFRVFDIIKPAPVRYFERLPGGLGIMADDQIAAIWASAILLLLVRLLPEVFGEATKS